MSGGFEMSSRIYNPDKLPAMYNPPTIRNLKQLYSAHAPLGEVKLHGQTNHHFGGFCKAKCESYPNYTKWVSKTHRYCRGCEKGIPISDIILKNRCPCCKQPIRFTSTWTESKRLRSLQVTK